jgi:hypothetical protein
MLHVWLSSEGNHRMCSDNFGWLRRPSAGLGDFQKLVFLPTSNWQLLNLVGNSRKMFEQCIVAGLSIDLFAINRECVKSTEMLWLLPLPLY